LRRKRIAARERVLGPDHPDTLTARNNLAVAHQTAGQAAEAIPLHQQTLAARERVRGRDHPDTLTARNNLATAYRAAGRAAEAIPLFEQTLAALERVLGPDTPTPWPRGTTSPKRSGRRAGPPMRSRCNGRPSPTGSGS
jgi:hypothetical protein